MLRNSSFLLAVAALAILFNSSCAQPKRQTFYIKYDNVKNLKDGSDVYSKGIVVGKVTDLKILSDYKILVEIKIDQSIQPDKGHKFALVSYDFIGNQVVEIVPNSGSGENGVYTDKDTITGVVADKQLMVLDSLERKVGKDSLLTPLIKKQ